MRGLLFVLPVLAIVGVIAWWSGISGLSMSSEDAGPMMHAVEPGDFVHDITERGNVESASNVEIASEVKSTHGSTTILEIVPEGLVIKPEDCVPEDAVIPLGEIEKLWDYRIEHGLKLADVPTQPGTRDPENQGSGETQQAAQAGGAKQSDVADGDSAASASDSEAAESADAEHQEGQVAASEGSEGNGQTQVAESGGRAPEHLESRPDYTDAEGPVLTFEDLKDKTILVKLDSASLENERTQQQIVCENSTASVALAESTYKTAQIALQEYLEGTYEQSKQEFEGKIVVAKENLARAREYLDYSKLLHAKGYLSDRELEANEFDVEKKTIELDEAKTGMKVLKKYSKEKMLTQLEADIESAKAKLEAAKKSYELDLEKLREIEDQISNCTIFAAKPGQVVYANERSHRYGNEIVIEPGTAIRERQVIIRLPDPSQMQVKARVNEARINLVRPGMQVKIRLEASTEEELSGEVEEVSEYPAPTSWYNSNVKEYEAIVKIHDPPPGLRPGFTAEVRIRVAEASGVLQVPVLAVFEHGGKHYSVLPDGDGFRAQEVRIGLTNGKFVIIEEGLQEGDQVVLNAAAHREELDLPEVPDETQLAAADDTPVPPGPRGEGRTTGGGPSGAGAPGDATQGERSPDGTAAGARPTAGQIFQQLDRDGNQKIEAKELSQLPAEAQSRLKAADANNDGIIERSELTAAMNSLSAPPGGAPPRQAPAQAPQAGSRPGDGS